MKKHLKNRLLMLGIAILSLTPSLIYSDSFINRALDIGYIGMTMLQDGLYSISSQVFNGHVSSRTGSQSTMMLKGYIGYVPQAVADLVAQIRSADAYAKMGVELTKGIIFYGSPGSGKTHLARAISWEIGCPFIPANAADFKQSLVGLGKDAVVNLFAQAREAAANHASKVAIIFIDEFDAVGTRNTHDQDGGISEVVNTLLSEMDGFNKQNEIHIVVIAATNFLERIDPALTRSGRFDYKVYVPYPDAKARRLFIVNFLRKYPSDLNISVSNLVKQTYGMSPADIVLLFDLAGRVAVRSGKSVRDSVCFDEALSQLRARR